jgi:hypothetical protein
MQHWGGRIVKGFDAFSPSIEQDLGSQGQNFGAQAMMDHLMNSTRRVLIFAQHPDDAELEDAVITPCTLRFRSETILNCLRNGNLSVGELRLSGDEEIVMPRVRPKFTAQPSTYGRR